MSRDVLSLEEDQDLSHLETAMRLLRFRHMPVTDDGKLAGVVTQRDLPVVDEKNVLVVILTESDFVMLDGRSKVEVTKPSPRN